MLLVDILIRIVYYFLFLFPGTAGLSLSSGYCSAATVASYSPSSSPTRTQSAQGSPTNSHKPWRPRARSADESTRKIVRYFLTLR